MYSIKYMKYIYYTYIKRIPFYTGDWKQATIKSINSLIQKTFINNKNS